MSLELYSSVDELLLKEPWAPIVLGFRDCSGYRPDPAAAGYFWDVAEAPPLVFIPMVLAETIRAREDDID